MVDLYFLAGLTSPSLQRAPGCPSIHVGPELLTAPVFLRTPLEEPSLAHMLNFLRFFLMKKRDDIVDE